MELAGRVAIVTGGASGIGAALCRRFAAEGARGVVVADREAAGAAKVAAEIGGLGVASDVSHEADVAGLVASTRERFGRVDLFFANAGIAVGAGLDPLAAGPFASDADWDASWRVNVMAHVYAARACLPEWLERGEGYFASTASAAGLLMDMGTHAYTVTKHAAVAFAEWLAVAYGDRGVRVSCLCPQGVRTPMLLGAKELGLGEHLLRGMREPEEVAAVVVEALRAERFLILPHPEVAGYVQRRAADEDRWLAGMRRVRGRLYGGGEGAGRG